MPQQYQGMIQMWTSCLSLTSCLSRIALLSGYGDGGGHLEDYYDKELEAGRDIEYVNSEGLDLYCKREEDGWHETYQFDKLDDGCHHYFASDQWVWLLHEER